MNRRFQLHSRRHRHQQDVWRGGAIHERQRSAQLLRGLALHSISCSCSVAATGWTEAMMLFGDNWRQEPVEDKLTRCDGAASAGACESGPM